MTLTDNEAQVAYEAEFGIPRLLASPHDISPLTSKSNPKRSHLLTTSPIIGMVLG